MRSTQAPPTGLPLVQRQMWFADQVNRYAAGYLVPIRLEITGALDVEALRRALTEIVTRHEVLRTSVEVVDDDLVAVVRPPSAFEVPLDEVDDVAEALADDATRPFDIETDVPVRARILRCGDTHTLSIVVHHMAFDGWSQGLLYEELEALYSVPGSLPPLSVQYRDLAVTQEHSWHTESFEEQLDQWRRTLADLVPFELPPDRPRPERRDGRGAVRTFDVPADVADRLVALAARCGASLHMVLVAACQAVLGRHANRTDVTVGSTYSTRDDLALAQAIGLFVNMAALRGDTSGDPAFTELVERVREVALDGYDCRDVPFARVVQELGGDRDPSRTPLFGILIDLVARPRRAPGLPGLEVRELPGPCVGAKYDLTIAFDEDLRARVTWDVALYDEATIARVCADLRAFLVAASAHPEARLSTLHGRGNDDA